MRFCARRRRPCAISSKILQSLLGSTTKPFVRGDAPFHANVDLMLVAFVTGVLVEGFSTLIAKSFNITGRVASTKRRLQQNNRHMMDIFGNYILDFTKPIMDMARLPSGSRAMSTSNRADVLLIYQRRRELPFAGLCGCCIQQITRQGGVC